MLNISAAYHDTRAKRKAVVIYQSMESATSSQCTSLSDMLSSRMKVLWEENLRNDEKEKKESPMGSGRFGVIM